MGLREDCNMDYRNPPGYLKCALKCSTPYFKSESFWVDTVFSAV